MFRKWFYLSLLAGLGLPALGGEVRTLPRPVITGGMPLMEAINARHSGRAYDTSRAVDDQTLGEILWAAWGVNTRGKRTIATARNQQNMSLYLLTPQGTWKYDGKAHALEKVNEENLIPLCNQQPFVEDAPVHLLFAAQDDRWGRAHVGSAYQNVYLYATSKGLATVIRGLIDDKGLTKALGLKGKERVIAHQTVGWPAPETEK